MAYHWLDGLLDVSSTSIRHGNDIHGNDGFLVWILMESDGYIDGGYSSLAFRRLRFVSPEKSPDLTSAPKVITGYKSCQNWNCKCYQLCNPDRQREHRGAKCGDRGSHPKQASFWTELCRLNRSGRACDVRKGMGCQNRPSCSSIGPGLRYQVTLPACPARSRSGRSRATWCAGKTLKQWGIWNWKGSPGTSCRCRGTTLSAPVGVGKRAFAVGDVAYYWSILAEFGVVAFSLELVMHSATMNVTALQCSATTR